MKQHFKLGFRCRGAYGAVKPRGRNTLGIAAVALRQRERLHIDVIGLEKAVGRGALNPVQ